MTYDSKKPTREKKEFFNFMEMKKSGGTVSGKEVQKYASERGYVIRPQGISSGTGERFFTIENSRGTNLMGGAINKRKRITNWGVQ
jgi:hypothetical protein